MCLIYNHNAERHQQPFTAYKVYNLIGTHLHSPFNDKRHHGEICISGTYEVDVPSEILVYSTQAPNRPTYVIARRGASYETLPLTESAHEHEIDIPGFHCLLVENEAHMFAGEVKKLFESRLQSLEEGLIERPIKITPVIVKLEINPKDVIAYGNTPYGMPQGTQYTPLNAKTVVTTKITLSQEEITKAIWEPFLSLDPK